MNAAMRSLMDGGVPSIQADDAPLAFREIAGAGWLLDDRGAVLLVALNGPNGQSAPKGVEDISYFEAQANGRGMMDYDLSVSGAERKQILLRRSLAYACLALRNLPEQIRTPVHAYISMSEGGLSDDTVTANVTFSAVRDGVAAYIDDIDIYEEEALLELTSSDARGLLYEPGL
ncbi:hypothetical protein GT030_25635 [Streptomyces sp. SID1328]|uniref:hypothetical protein n=1 Tax=Streptomyces sp. SID1328 TaxID=2690250 RepID=UPI00136ADDDE|nr:hypothetical protein [Streptomyces sp. SID1328]MYV42156.1 hypothetical protein [Streptomyces sp. SID1328]